MNAPFVVDLNCDMGESFGAYHLGQDEAILPLVTSVNIACGFHAGDPAVMKRTVRLARDHGVAIGAHPGLPDLAGFGRRDMAITPDEAYDLVVYQMGALAAFVRAEGGRLHHLKPHGALYNMAAGQEALAEAIAEAVYRVDPAVALYGLAGSALIRAGRKRGLKTAQEVFADRTYQPDGTLTPRRQPQALITDPGAAARQVVQMIKTGKVVSVGGEEVAIRADTVCIHGDGPRALDFARHLRQALQSAGIGLRAGANLVAA
jgi:5-oxoprolinase (ATP-hydrolysing) subunit A